MINFKLKSPDELLMESEKGDSTVSWFWLTDGDLWWALGNTTLYEYTPEALARFEHKQSPYSDYWLARFIEDFTEVFADIGESVPPELYALTEDLDTFLNEAGDWMEMYETEDEEASDFYFEEYDDLISWTYNRSFGSNHLVGGPGFSFFRCDDKIRIIWETQMEDGTELWTAKSGQVEMSYNDFVGQVTDFGKRFFEKMSRQVELAVEIDWGDIQLDKEQLVAEHATREQDFYFQLAALEKGPEAETDWGLVRELLHRMRKELKSYT